MKQGILEKVKEHTDWVNSYVIVEKDTGNHRSPNHTVKKKLRICLDPRDLNEALREPYHTRSVDEITAKLQGMTVFPIVDFKKGYWMTVLHPKFPSGDRMEHIRHFPTSMEMCMDNRLTLTTEKTQQKQFQGKASEQCCSNTQHFTGLTEEHCSQPCRIPTEHGKYAIFPRETVPTGKREIHIARHRKHATFPREPVPARKEEIHIGDQTEAIHGYVYIYIGD